MFFHIYVHFKNKPINSGIFFVNDIIDNNGKIMQEFILHKLKNKSNWISEFSILKKAFPKNWRNLKMKKYRLLVFGFSDNTK
jgi:hypothetical protein